MPDEHTCALDTDLWWGLAMRFPKQALLQMELSGRLPSRDPGQPCPVIDCDCAGKRGLAETLPPR